MENANIVHFNIEISGRVQGVGFRYSTVQAARRYGIKGFVKNMNNGNVYIEAEGTKKNIEEFTRWCTSGPSLARVENVEVAKSSLKGFSFFDVKH